MSHDHAWGSAVIIFAVVLFAVLFVAGAIKARRQEAADDQRDYDALRVWETRQDNLDESTPIYDQLAAEHVVASAGEVLAAEWKRAEVYDVDDWPGAS